jgi:hypothetical protein
MKPKLENVIGTLLMVVSILSLLAIIVKFLFLF